MLFAVSGVLSCSRVFWDNCVARLRIVVVVLESCVSVL